METVTQEARAKDRSRFVCRDHQTPIFISNGLVACGRENDHCWLKVAHSKCPYGEEIKEKKEKGKKGKREIKIACPHNKPRLIFLNLDSNFVECACFREMVKSGGCRSGGCFLVGPYSLNVCPFEKTGQINGRG